MKKNKQFGVRSSKFGAKSEIVFLFFVFVLIAYRLPLIAAVHTAADCSQAAVQTAISAAAAGDTVIIPPGISTWTASITWNAPSNVVLQGAGNQSVVGGGDATIIVDNINRTSTDPGLLTITPNASGTFRMTGITIQGSSNSNALTWNGSLRFGGASQQLRVDHVHLQNNQKVGMVIDGPIGVVDHCLLEWTLACCNNSIRVYHGSWKGVGNYGDNSWADDTALGSNKFVFIEDCTFSGGFADDSTNGGRVVFRHNTFNGAQLQTHPTGGGDRDRGCRAWEIYGNTFGGSNSNPVYSVWWLSSGTGVIWGNNAPTGYENFVSMHSMRKDNTTYGQTPPPNGWGYCGTAFNGTGSAWDQNSNASSGYACLDQPGQGKSDLMTGYWPNVTNTVTGTVAWPHQALEPVYEWLNTWTPATGYSASGYWGVSAPTVLAQNRDYYLYTASFSGATGVGSGLLSARPATCTAGVAYWATDTSTLYKCTATNTWTVFYTPYTYPHPLTGGPDTTPPVISAVSAGSITQNGATIIWTTDEGATSQVEYGTTTSYGSSSTLNSTLVLSHSVNVTGLNANTLYHYRVKSADGSSNASTGTDNTFTTSAPDTTPPVISAVSAGTPASTSATITWTTDEGATSQVEYGLTTSYGSSSALNGSLATSHSTGISGLTASTVYHYRVKSSDAYSNASTGSDNTFTTSAPGGDTIPPVISGVSAGSLTQHTALINWTTNEGATSQVEYGLTTTYGSSTAVGSSLVTIHSANLTGLATGTLYHYRVKSADASSNMATGTDNTFTTATLPDTTPPVISAVVSSNITNATARIAWTTNETADSQVEYGATTSYGSSTALDSSLVTSHIVNLTGLSAGTLYHYHVKSADASSNMATGTDNTFTTTTTADTTPPTAPGQVRDGTGVDVSQTNSLTDLSANWTAATDTESGVAKYWYAIGTTPGATDITGGWIDNGLNMSVTKTGLSLNVGQTYYFSVKADDVAGNNGPAANSNGQTVTSGVIIPPPTTETKVYPNPYSLSAFSAVTFSAQSAIKEIKIFTVSGKLAKTLSGTAAWDGTNESGNKVNIGIYMYKLTQTNGDSIIGKLAIIK